MFLGGDSDEGEMVRGVQVPHEAAGPLYQLGNLRRVLQTQKVKLVLNKIPHIKVTGLTPVMLCYDTL